MIKAPLLSQDSLAGMRLAQFNRQAYTLPELLVAASIAAVVGGVLLTSMLSLRRSLDATADYTAAQAGQARLLEYVSRDLRKITGTAGILSPAISTGFYTSIGTVTNPSAVVTANSKASGTLTLVVPGYYASGGKSVNPNLLVFQSGTLGYGTLSGGAPSVATGTIQYFKAPQNYTASAPDSCWRYVRVESGAATSGTTTVVEKADGMLLEIMKSGSSSPAAYSLRVRFTPTFQSKKTGRPTEPTSLSTSVTSTGLVVLRGTN